MIQFVDIDRRYFHSLNRVFSPIVLDDLIQRGKSDYLDEVVTNSGVVNMIHQSIRLEEFFDGIYDFLSKYYCSEYIYKNALAERMYSGIHFQNSHMLTELRVGTSKADVVILNGTSTVYEIKSELDSFDRLDDQISDYSCFFDRINVITSLSQVEQLLNRLSPNIGIIALSSDNSIEIQRESASNKSHVIPSVIFNSFRKDEYLRVIKKQFGSIPEVPNTRIHRACFELFCELSPETAHAAMLEALYARGNTSYLKEFVLGVPRSLKAYAASYGMNEENISKFAELLKQSAHSVFSQVTH